MIYTTDNNTQLLLTPKQAAATLSISLRKLGALKSEGAIPYHKIGRLTRYSLTDLQAFADSNRSASLEVEL